jgi:nucleoside-diphosphate-sugar epimerase
MPRLLILGCGYVGTAVARQARAAGWAVMALTRNPAKAGALATEGITTVVGDLAGSEWHARVGDQFDFVLNCVAAGGGGVAGYRRSYLAGMESLLAWAKRTRPGTLVYTSSTSVYAQGGGMRVDESLPAEGRSETAKVLVATECLLREPAPGEEPAVGRWFVLRLAGIYGPERHSLLDELRQGATQLPGSGTHRLNLAFRDDIADAIMAAFQAPPAVRNQVFNVADDAPTTKAEVGSWLGAQLGRPAAAFTGGSDPRRTAVPDRVIANDCIKAALGWRPRHPTFRDGYAEILAGWRPGVGDADPC